jgi:hypothetical protein
MKKKTLREFMELNERAKMHLHIKKGAFHAWLGKDPSQPITGADIQRGLAAGGHAAKMANFAKNARRWHHEDKDHHYFGKVAGTLGGISLGSFVGGTGAGLAAIATRRKPIAQLGAQVAGSLAGSIYGGVKGYKWGKKVDRLQDKTKGKTKK